MWWCEPCARRDEEEDARLQRVGRHERHWMVELEGARFASIEGSYLVCMDGFGLRQLRSPRRFGSEGSIYDVDEEHVIWRSSSTDIADEIEELLDEDDESEISPRSGRILVRDLSP